MKIVILDGYTENPGDLSWDGFQQLGELQVYDRTPPQEVASRIGDAEIVLLNKTPLSRETLDACPNIRYIGVLATGFNVVDTRAARERGIVITNVPSYGTAIVSQFTFALLLELCHHVGKHWDSVIAGEWSACPDYCYWHYPLIELAGKTMGIIGFGRIGRQTAVIAQAMGMKVLAYDHHQDLSLETETLHYTSLENLYAQSDVISLHCPLEAENIGMINRNSISQMKEGALIINTARGLLIQEDDLAEALNSGRLGGAAVDVASAEPIRPSNPLLTAKNCIITPHIAWAAKESRQRLMEIAVSNLKAYLDGHPVNQVLD